MGVQAGVFGFANLKHLLFFLNLPKQSNNLNNKKMTILCKICLQYKEASHSHLTPKSLTNKSKHLEINKRGITKGAKGSGMPFDDKIICRDCEKIFFNDLDRKFAEFIKEAKEANKTKRFHTDNLNPEIYRIDLKIDYTWLDTFSASLLYRHSLSDSQKVKLGKYEITAKQMIEKFNNKTPLDHEQKIFATTCIINTSRKLSKNIISKDITSYKQYGMVKVYRFLAGDGIELHIKVSNQNSAILSHLRDIHVLLAMPLADDFTMFTESAINKSLLLRNK